MKTERLELRVEPELKARVVAECERRGMKVATFVERAIEAALPSDLPVAVQRALAMASPTSGDQQFVEGAFEAAEGAAVAPRRSKPAASGELPKIAKRHWA